MLGLINQSCISDVAQASIYHMSPACPRYSAALQLQNHGPKHHSFHFISSPTTLFCMPVPDVTVEPGDYTATLYTLPVIRYR